MNITFEMVLMLIVSLAWIIWFLQNPLVNTGVDLKQSNIDLGKQRKTELQQDFDQGLIDKEQFDLALDEISATLAVELNQKMDTIVNSKKISISTWIIILVMPIFSIGVYQSLTTYSPAINKVLDANAQPLSLKQSVEKIKEHLASNPTDIEAWKMLGLSYFELNKINESLEAYEQAYQLDPKDARLLVEYASTMISANNDQFEGRPVELIKQALEINPNAPDALYLAGMFAVSMQDFELAKGLWNKALNALPEGSSDQQALLSILEELKREESVQKSHTVTVGVEISDKVLTTRSEEDFLMIYVRPSIGRPMPIAIEKIQIKDFKGQVVLSDMNSLMPTKLLSEHDQVIVVARISRTGSAIKQSDDLQEVSGVVKVSDNPSIVIKLD